jgi:hypothetical protein
MPRDPLVQSSFSSRLSNRRGLTLAAWSGNARGVKSIILTLLSVSLLTSLLSGTTEARRRGHGRSRQSAAVAQAYRAMAIQNIQQQIGIARNVLGSAESKAAMSQSTVSSAISRLTDAREQINSAHEDVALAAKALHDLEKEILADLPPNAELNIAKEVLQQAKNSMHDALHRLFNIPHVTGKSDEAARLAEFESLSDEQKAILEKDPGYQVAQREMQAAAAQVTHLRREVLMADKEWVDARQELTDADKRSREGTQQATTAGMSMFGGQQKLRSNQQIAAFARSVIAQGEARLRQLGANPNGSSSALKKKKK